MILKAKDIRKTFGPTIALDNAQVELKDGEVNALVGESNSRSTLYGFRGDHDRWTESGYP